MRISGEFWGTSIHRSRTIDIIGIVIVLSVFTTHLGLALIRIIAILGSKHLTAFSLNKIIIKAIFYLNDFLEERPAVGANNFAAVRDLTTGSTGITVSTLIIQIKPIQRVISHLMFFRWFWIIVFNRFLQRIESITK